ncbi:MAG: hypothetical protein MZU84_01400 [Sphingobacterium sp.]|nr:hypothetical protein [Sphingobacterium sp.]
MEKNWSAFIPSIPSSRLNDPAFQLAVIDDYAGIHAEVNEYRSGFRNLTELKRELAGLSVLEQRSRGEDDYNRFLLEELAKANLRDGEQEELENARRSWPMPAK